MINLSWHRFGDCHRAFECFSVDIYCPTFLVLRLFDTTWLGRTLLKENLAVQLHPSLGPGYEPANEDFTVMVLSSLFQVSPCNQNNEDEDVQVQASIRLDVWVVSAFRCTVLGPTKAHLRSGLFTVPPLSQLPPFHTKLLNLCLYKSYFSFASSMLDSNGKLLEARAKQRG